MKTFLKNLIMTIIAFISSYLYTQVEAGESVNYAFMLITVLGMGIVYFSKNSLIPSDSEFLTLNLKDFLSGLSLAVGNAIVIGASSYLTATELNWSALGITVGTAFLGYMSKTFSQNKEGSILTKLTKDSS